MPTALEPPGDNDGIEAEAGTKVGVAPRDGEAEEGRVPRTAAVVVLGDQRCLRPAKAEDGSRYS